MKLIIIGGGAAGHAAALTVKHVKPSISVTMFSEEGFPLYSPCLLPEYLSSSLLRERVFLNTCNVYPHMGVEALHCKVTEIDLKNKRVLSEAGTFLYDRLLLALGAHVRKLPFEDPHQKGFFPLKTLKDADAIVSHLATYAAVIGSGNIGIEAAMALHRRGCKVTLFETESTVNPFFFPPAFSNKIQKALESEGIKIVTGARITKILGEKHVEALKDRGFVYRFGLIINATGTVPNTEIAQRAGLVIGPKGGILVNHHMKTSHPEVYACGDCIEFTSDDYFRKNMLSGLWPNAIHQGRIAGYNLVNMSKKQRGLFNLRTFRIRDHFAISLGWSERDLSDYPEIDVIDYPSNPDTLAQICLLQGKLVAARFWGKALKLGPLISSVESKWKMGMSSSVVENRGKMSLYPFYNYHRLHFSDQRDKTLFRL